MRIDYSGIYILVCIDLHWNALAAIHTACNLRERGYNVCIYMTFDTLQTVFQFPFLQKFVSLQGDFVTDWTSKYMDLNFFLLKCYSC